MQSLSGWAILLKDVFVWHALMQTLQQSRALTLLCGVAVIAALHFSRGILLPFALAILLSFLLSPLVARLERWKCPRIVAVLLVVAVSFASLGILGSVVVRQLYDLAYHLPDYKVNLINKAQAFRSEGDGVFTKLTDAFTDVFENVSRKKAGSVLKSRSRTRFHRARRPRLGAWARIPVSLRGCLIK